MTIKAIQTKYKGYHFRSRIEARWAVFFDALGVKWEYEPEGFELSNGKRYLPDFWLPETKAWVEIKGSDPTEEEVQKCDEFANEQIKLGNKFRFLIGNIPENGVVIAGYNTVPCVSWIPPANDFPEYVFFFGQWDGIEIGSRFMPSNWIIMDRHELVPKSLRLSRSARFEYGESPS